MSELFKQLASARYLEGRTDRDDGLQRRAVEILMDERQRQDRRERRELKRMVARGQLSRRQVERALGR